MRTVPVSAVSEGCRLVVVELRRWRCTPAHRRWDVDCRYRYLRYGVADAVPAMQTLLTIYCGSPVPALDAHDVRGDMLGEEETRLIAILSAIQIGAPQIARASIQELYAAQELAVILEAARQVATIFKREQLTFDVFVPHAEAIEGRWWLAERMQTASVMH